MIIGEGIIGEGIFADADIQDVPILPNFGTWITQCPIVSQWSDKDRGQDLWVVKNKQESDWVIRNRNVNSITRCD